MFPVFQIMSMHIKLCVLWQILKNDMILWYDNRQPMVMVAILNKKFLHWDFGGLCTRVLSGHPSNLKNSAFYIFSRLKPNTPGLIHKTIPTSSIMLKKSSLFGRIYHNYHPMTFRYAHEANFSNISKCDHKFTKIHIKQNSEYNT